MAFPTTSVLDDFNTGALQSVTARSGWGGASFFSGNIGHDTNATPTYADGTSNVADPRSNYWAAEFTDSEVWVLLGTITAGTGNAGRIDLFTRGSSPNTATPGGYMLSYLVNAGTWTLKYLPAGGGAAQDLSGGAVSGTNAIASNDSIGLSSVRGWHTAYLKSGAGAWTQIGQGSDATASSGVLAVQTIALQQLNSFGGGAVLPASVDFSGHPKLLIGNRITV